MEQYDYIKLPLDIIPDEVAQQYRLHDVVRQGFLYMGIQKGMYVLPQAGNISNDKPKQHLTKFGYDIAPITPRL